MDAYEQQTSANACAQASCRPRHKAQSAAGSCEGSAGEQTANTAAQHPGIQGRAGRLCESGESRAHAKPFCRRSTLAADTWLPCSALLSAPQQLRRAQEKLAAPSSRHAHTTPCVDPVNEITGQSHRTTLAHPARQRVQGHCRICKHACSRHQAGLLNSQHHAQTPHMLSHAVSA